MMSFKSSVTNFQQSVDGSLGRLDRFLKLSDARERRALAGRVSVSYTRKDDSNQQIHRLLTQILRAATKPNSATKLSALATQLRRCDCSGKGSDYLSAVADLAEATAQASKRTRKYSPDQPRDPDTGQWVDAGGGGGNSASAAMSSMPKSTVSGIKDTLSGALSGSSQKLVTGARAVRDSVDEALTPGASVMIAETLVIATVAAFFFFFQRSATAMQLGLGALDMGLKGLRFLRPVLLR